MRKVFISLVAALCVAFMAKAQTSNLFTPYKATSLRLPSVPLVVSDPYFSIWSPYNTLNGGVTKHWTNDEKPLEGILRVDGKNYRFLGAKRIIPETIVPMADEQAWTGAISRTKQADGWQRPDFDDSKWKRAKAAFGSPGLSFVRTEWKQEHSDLYVRRTVDLTEKDLQGDLFLI